MSVLLLDTNVVSILFKPDHSLHAQSFGIVAGHQRFISFMTRGELMLWPKVNQWGSTRREELTRHVDLRTTLFPDEGTCVVWADIMAESRVGGTADHDSRCVGRRCRPSMGPPTRNRGLSRF